MSSYPEPSRAHELSSFFPSLSWHLSYASGWLKMALTGDETYNTICNYNAARVSFFITTSISQVKRISATRPCRRGREWEAEVEKKKGQMRGVSAIQCIYIVGRGMGRGQNERQKEQKNNTRDSNVVPHRSTNSTRQCLTSLSRREAVLSLWYGRSCKWHWFFSL